MPHTATIRCGSEADPLSGWHSPIVRRWHSPAAILWGLSHHCVRHVDCTSSKPFCHLFYLLSRDIYPLNHRKVAKRLFVLAEGRGAPPLPRQTRHVGTAE